MGYYHTCSVAQLYTETIAISKLSSMTIRIWLLEPDKKILKCIVTIFKSIILTKAFALSLSHITWNWRKLYAKFNCILREVINPSYQTGLWILNQLPVLQTGKSNICCSKIKQSRTLTQHKMITCYKNHKRYLFVSDLKPVSFDRFCQY